MDAQKHAAAVFRDFEKIYRLSGLYQGNPQQLQKQLSFIDNNLETHFRTAFGRGGSIRFDLLMTAVFFQNEEIYKSEQPEYTISYALFYEGIKSLTFKGGITAQEMFDWIAIVKSVLNASSEEEDLASVLWKKSSANIKVSLYSLFSDEENLEVASVLDTDLEEDDSFDEVLAKEVLESEFQADQQKGLDTSWQERDEAWDLPSGDLIVQKLGSLGIFDSEAAERLKRELSDAAVSDKARKIIRFSPDEIESLRKELESYDENQVEFNLMVHYLSILERVKSDEKSYVGFLTDSVRKIIQSVISRFHGGLIMFSLRRLKIWKEGPLRARYEEIEPNLRASLSDEKNLQLLGEAFGQSSRMKIAKELAEFLDPKYAQYVFHYLVERNLNSAEKNFIRALIGLGFPMEQLLSSWSVEDLKAAIPHLIELEWDKKELFLLRCLRSKNREISEEMIKYIDRLEIQSAEALSIFLKQRAIAQRHWIEALLRTSDTKPWEAFVGLGTKNEVWRQSTEEVNALWVTLAFRILGGLSFSLFDPYVKGRRFVLFPKYRNERELILGVALNQRDPKVTRGLQTWLESEQNLLFQSSELKQRMRERAK